MTLKDTIKQFRHSNKWSLRLVYHTFKPFWMIRRLLTDAPYRSAMITALKSGRTYHQHEVFTMPDRYPKLFAAASEYLSTTAQPRLLSYGCSTGEEVASLGRYMPGAMIMGVDINEWCIRQCRKTFSSPNFSFWRPKDPAFLSATGFDAIFCMAVFQHTDNRDGKNGDKAQQFLFDQFEGDLQMLDTKLRIGGLLIIDNTDFNFQDTECSKHYAPLQFENNRVLRKRPLFDSNNKKIADTQNNFRVFVKEAS
jgi:hypothetical protein